MSTSPHEHVSAEMAVLSLVLDEADEGEIFALLRTFHYNEVRSLELAARALQAYCQREQIWRDRERRAQLSPGEAVMDLLHGPKSEGEGQ